MHILSWNVNGIRAVHRKGLFLPFIDTYQPDILCLQETKAEQHQSEVDLPGYEEYWNSSVRKGYSGTAIFTKHKPVAVHLGFPSSIAKKFMFQDSYGDLSTEGRVIALEFKSFYVVSVYTPNVKDDLSRLSIRSQNWDPAFLMYMQHLEQKKPVVFCGDINVAHTEDDLARPKANTGKKGFTQEERDGMTSLLAAGFIDTFRMFTQGSGHYTWWSHMAGARARNVGWRIDYICVSEQLKSKVKKADIHANVLGSDHCPISIDIQL